MEQVALRLESSDRWTWLGGNPGARKPPCVVLRAFDAAVRFTSGAGPDQPQEDLAVVVPAGEGRRLSGTHFFARLRDPGPPCRISLRGI